MPKEECNCPPEGLPAWMGTFADLMSLLMCFFVLLLSFSEMDVLKFKQIAGSMKNAFGVQSKLKVKDIPKGTSVIAQEFRPGKPEPTPIEVIHQKTIEMTKAELDLKSGESDTAGGDNGMSELAKARIDLEQEGQQEEAPAEKQDRESSKTKLEVYDPVAGISGEQGTAKKIAKLLQKEIEDGSVEVEALGQQLIVRVREKGVFPPGSAFLQPNFRPIVQKIANILVDIPGVISISGHTDNEPIQSELYRSNWDLSAQRAVSVAHEMLIVKGVREKGLIVMGYANSKPLTTNKTRTERSRNRRVEITMMQGKAKESEPVELINSSKKEE
ncbi:MAG: flagellar motor protein MotB [Psychromonas sp.]|nr:flagellar motor protein MotB [Psychromonas sp.]